MQQPARRLVRGLPLLLVASACTLDTVGVAPRGDGGATASSSADAASASGTTTMSASSAATTSQTSGTGGEGGVVGEGGGGAQGSGGAGGGGGTGGPGTGGAGGRGDGGSGGAGGAGGEGGGGGGAPVCGPTGISASELAAYRADGDKTLDGLDDDWACDMPFAQTTASSELVAGTPLAYGAWRFEWRPDALWVFVEVTDPVLEGSDPMTYLNDAVELYIAGAPATDADYGADDHHVVVDHRGEILEYSPPAELTYTPVGIDAKVQVTSVGYDVEMRLAADALGGPLDARRTLGIDLQIDDGIGQPNVLLWTIAAHGACGACSADTCCCLPGDDPGDLPYCDTLRFGTLHLG